MRMIPSSPGPETRSRAERRVFDLLKNTALSSDAACFHSTKLSEHDYKIAGEIDFIVLTPSGILVLEVKGGGVTRSENGSWTYRDRFGREARCSEGPCEHSRSRLFEWTQTAH